MKPHTYKSSTFVVNSCDITINGVTSNGLVATVIIPVRGQPPLIHMLPPQETVIQAQCRARDFIDSKEDSLHAEQAQGGDPEGPSHIGNDKIRLVSTRRGVSRTEGTPQSIPKSSARPLKEGPPHSYLDEDNPLWGINEQIKDILLHMFAASEDHQDIIEFFQRAGLPEWTAKQVHLALLDRGRLNQEAEQETGQTTQPMEDFRGDSLEQEIMDKVLGKRAKLGAIEMLCEVTAAKSVSLFSFLYQIDLLYKASQYGHKDPNIQSHARLFETCGKMLDGIEAELKGKM